VSPRLRIALVVCVCVSGCGVPPAAPPAAPAPAAGPQQPSSAVAQAQATHEYRSVPAPAQSAAGASQSAAAAITAFATAYINWTAQTVSDDMRALAAASVGQARAAAQLAAAQTAGDYELQRGGIANTGVVEAIAPLRGHRDQYVVVTRESTTATATTAYQGLRPAWHLAIATVSLLSSGRWVVSGWQPEG
jgi:hypothetical protein